MTRHTPSPTANAQDVTATHTPGPWECVDATKHHGFYITSPWGGTVCDLYTMSNPSAASVRNGGDSFPIAHQEGYDGANARLIAAAPDFAEAAPDAADFLEHYVDFIRASVKADDLERHPYLPSIEQAASDLRAALAKATAA